MEITRKCQTQLLEVSFYMTLSKLIRKLKQEKEKKKSPTRSIKKKKKEINQGKISSRLCSGLVQREECEGENEKEN